MSTLLYFNNQPTFALAREGSPFHLTTLPHLPLRAALIQTISFVLVDAAMEGL